MPSRRGCARAPAARGRAGHGAGGTAKARLNTCAVVQPLCKHLSSRLPRGWSGSTAHPVPTTRPVLCRGETKRLDDTGHLFLQTPSPEVATSVSSSPHQSTPSLTAQPWLSWVALTVEGLCSPQDLPFPAIRPCSFFVGGRRHKSSLGISLLSLTCHLEFLFLPVCLCRFLLVGCIHPYLTTPSQAPGALPRTWLLPVIRSLYCFSL